MGRWRRVGVWSLWESGGRVEEMRWRVEDWVVDGGCVMAVTWEAEVIVRTSRREGRSGLSG